MKGATFSGKSILVKRLYKERERLFSPIPKTCVYRYFEENEMVEELEADGIVTKLNLPSFDYLASLEGPSLVCIDDGIDSCDKNYLMRLLQRTTHHHQIALLFVSQSLFQPAPLMQIVKQQAHYIIFLKSPSQILAIRNFSLQAFGNKFKQFLEAFDDAVTSKPIGSYIVISFHPRTKNLARIMTGIFRNETLTLYQI